MPRHLNKSLVVGAWPLAHRQAWNAALEHGDVLRDGGPASHWRASTARTVSRSYGHLLVWSAEHGLLDGQVGPTDVVTSSNLTVYASETAGKVSGSTVASRVGHIHMAVQVMVPGADWAWLRDLWLKLKGKAKPARNKAARLVEVADLFTCGIRAMEEADKGLSLCLFDRAKLFRDGLMVALLAARPFRLANLTQIEIGRHLVRCGDGYDLLFDAEDTKTWRAIEAPFPVELIPYLEKYLHMYRPVFWRNPKRDLQHANKLWLSTWGRGLCENMVYRRVMNLTKARLGIAVNPHAFRHAAATSIAFHDPEHVRIVMSILGHTTLATSERYYILAQTTEAARRYHEHIDELRKE